MGNSIYLYPFWLRLWHWTNAFMFLILIITGASMHYAEPGRMMVKFETAVFLHNLCGITLTVFYGFFFIGNIITGNFRQYLPALKGLHIRLLNQGKYYLFGIFRGDPHPTHATLEQKFNPLQQITYLNIMYLLVPLIISSGVLLLFPEKLPENLFGAGGIWPVALAHTVLGFFGAMFMIGHIYLATTGDTILSNFKGMISGWHNDSSH